MLIYVLKNAIASNFAVDLKGSKSPLLFNQWGSECVLVWTESTKT